MVSCTPQKYCCVLFQSSKKTVNGEQKLVSTKVPAYSVPLGLSVCSHELILTILI